MSRPDSTLCLRARRTVGTLACPGVRVSALVFLLLFCALFAYAVADGAWLRSVPVRDRQRINPYRDQQEAIAAGRRIFSDHCSQCHGASAMGNAKHPSLRSPRIQEEATEGDLHWLVVNGNLRRGMPSWSKLGDAQIWQVIAYVKSLKQEPVQ